MKTIKVKKCIHGCHFFGSTMDGMECNHPYFDDKGAYENMIIKQGDIIPEKCPLRESELVVLTHYEQIR
jgi:hypothetical protein